MNSNTITTASTVFIHKSAKGALTMTFTDGDVNVTVFPEDITAEAAAFLKEHLNPEVQTKARNDGTERRFYMTNTVPLGANPFGLPGLQGHRGCLGAHGLQRHSSVTVGHPGGLEARRLSYAQDSLETCA